MKFKINSAARLASTEIVAAETFKAGDRVESIDKNSSIHGWKGVVQGPGHPQHPGSLDVKWDRTGLTGEVYPKMLKKIS